MQTHALSDLHVLQKNSQYLIDTVKSNLFNFWDYTNFVSKPIKHPSIYDFEYKLFVSLTVQICVFIKSINNTRTVKQLVSAQEKSQLPNHYSFLPWATITGAWNCTVKEGNSLLSPCSFWSHQTQLRVLLRTIKRLYAHKGTCITMSTYTWQLCMFEAFCEIKCWCSQI